MHRGIPRSSLVSLRGPGQPVDRRVWAMRGTAGRTCSPVDDVELAGTPASIPPRLRLYRYDPKTRAPLEKGTCGLVNICGRTSGPRWQGGRVEAHDRTGSHPARLANRRPCIYCSDDLRKMERRRRTIDRHGARYTLFAGWCCLSAPA